MVTSKLTKAEKEILNLLTDEFLTTKKIAIRRKTSVRAVQKIIKKLKEKGAYNIGSQKVRFIEGTSEPNGIRLHAEQWLIKIIEKNNNYKEKIGKSILIDNNTIRIHRDCISIYSNTYFYGNDVWSATAKSINYWNSLITKLEWELKIILIKPRKQNIERVRAEYAQIRNGLAIKCEKEAEKIKIRTREDGKIWFEIDNSFNLREAETKHPETAERDMQGVVEPFFNDLRDKESYLPSNTKDMIDKLAITSHNMLKYVDKTNENIAWLAENIKSHGPAWFGITKEARNIRKEVRRLSGILSQKKLTEF